ncbi:aspartate carbamoyltransferase catalytic subunit [Dokdonella sp.]|uniref:aspartate carbamoyltransferase catalytic subunit n=1 Tax=Dokdonella sp. TaxID=2291710 RepID=UPI002CAD1803|nr:aspartate carbamoyltransferase catalytic subunit [Dokdonella sp.]HOX71065.1 aspartate carbamoyltransferase catalytic subunit [Dokdonella sp.]HPN79064.1 aspartate carbamoyltransferase catalytic subunit [Dokdonella sp.]
MNTDLQIDSSGQLRHLITLDGLGRDRITALLDRAVALRDAFANGAQGPRLLAGRTIINLFFETSTRTRTSFELAARRLGADVVNFDIANSSTSKGESLEDTLATLEAMQADAFIVRHKENGTPARLAATARGAAILNAGDGNHAHPTQGLLDALTIRDHYPDFSGLKVTICGDIRHSRVARSDLHVLRALGVADIRLCGPASLMPASDEFPQCRAFDNLDDAIAGADVVIMLRLQRERMLEALVGDETAYFARFGLNRQRLQRAMTGALVMHPGPMNRGVEIAGDVADGPQSVILDQVANGIPMRMAVLAELLQH